MVKDLKEEGSATILNLASKEYYAAVGPHLPRKVQVMAFENFGQLWADDALEHLKLDAEILKAPYGHLPDLSKVEFSRRRLIWKKSRQKSVLG